MKERDLFLAALEIDDLAARRAHLQAECTGDAELLARVESLLASHEGQSQFLNTPAVEQIADGSDAKLAATILAGNDSTEDEDLEATKASHSNGPEAMTERQDDSDDETPLGYLEPSSKPGSIGRLAHYEVLNVIGSGAFGTVLRAFDDKLQRVVAIKVMAPELAATSPARKRFLREAQASAAIRHEHVVSIYAVEEKPTPYLVMEYIPGLTLQQRLDERGPLDIATVLRIGRQIAEGLAAAHAQELIHRDIKPGNILLESSVLDRVKITDFGLARAADDASLTQSGTIAGTPMYMAPEQALGKKLDQRADLFSFGSVLYQMVSGRPPFRANGTLAVLKRVTEDTPRPIREIIPEAPQWLCDIITKLHAKNPDERYQSAREIADVLANCEEQFKAHAGLKDFTLIPAATLQPAQRRGKQFTVAALAVLLLAFGLYSMNRPGGRPNVVEEPQVAKIGTGNPATADPVTSESAASPAVVTKQDSPPLAVAPFDAAKAREHQEAWAKHLGVPVEYTNSIGMKFMLIPPGEFMMGSTAAEIEAALKDVDPNDKHWQEGIKSEAPQHKVILTQPIYLGVNEATQAEYEKVMGTNPSHFAPMGMGKEAVAGMQTTEHPVEMVRWNDAAEFCAKLSQQEKLKPFYFRAGETITPLNGTGYRLPSEAEWEFACRAGTTTKYWIGDRDEDLVRAGWFAGKSGGRTHAAGELKANPFGLSDMHGNVWEWVQDRWDATWYGQFQNQPAINPNSPFSAGSPYVLRGGAGFLAASACRSSFRDAWGSTHRSHGIGFRVSLPVDAVKAAKLQTLPTVAKQEPPPLAVAPFNEEQAKQHQKAWADYLGVPVEKELSLGQDKNGKDVTLTMVLIPPGEFMIGAADDEQKKWLETAKSGNPNAKPDAFATIHMEDQRFVRITKPFWLSKLEFTTGQFRRFVESTDYRTDAETNGKGAVRPAAGKGFERLPELHWDNWGRISVDAGPVVNVSWNDAAKCCEWLSSQHPDLAFSLPTEAQWEFACRSGTKNSLYDCDTNEELREYAQFGDEVHFIQRGGQLRPNAFGLYDMLGNVSEWCSNWLAGHAMSPTDDPAGPAVPGKYEMRAIRGGSFVAKVWRVRSSKRDFYPPDDCFFDRGFRVAAAIAIDANPVQQSAKATAPANVADTPSAATEPTRPE